MNLYNNFKTELSELLKAIKLWEATIDLTLYKIKKTGWINLNSNDFDANPIAVYYNHELKKRIRIIQISQEEGIKWPFTFFVDEFGDSKTFHGNELVISSTLTEENLKKTSKLISLWTNENIISENQLKEKSLI